MHLIFGVSRYMCSREFKHLYLRAETRQAKKNYVMRHEWGVASDMTLQKHHPLTGQSFWKFLLRKVSVPVFDSAVFASVKPLLHDRWVDLLELMWWSYTRWVALRRRVLTSSGKKLASGLCWRTATMARSARALSETLITSPPSRSMPLRT